MISEDMRRGRRNILRDHEGQRPATVAGAAIVLAVQAVGVLLAASLAGLATGAGKSYQVSSGIAITLIGLGTAVALAFVARGLSRVRPWSRTPALLTQLFSGIVGIYLVQGGRYPWGVGALVLAAAGFVLLLAPASFRALSFGPKDR
jgi:hypothetical protein